MLIKMKVVIVMIFFLSFGVQVDIIFNVVIVGDQNMVDYVKIWLGLKFEVVYFGVKVWVIGIGFGDVGLNKISEKLMVQQESGVQWWDIDVVVVYQKVGGEQVVKGLL